MENDSIGTTKHQVFIYDDWDHSYNYVIELLISTLGVSKEVAFEMAREVDTKGMITIEAKDASDATRIHEIVLQAGPDPLIPYSKASLMVSTRSLNNNEVKTFSSRCRKSGDRIYFVSDEEMLKIQCDGKAEKSRLQGEEKRNLIKVYILLFLGLLGIIYLYWLVN